jgi:hypothetical protein
VRKSGVPVDATARLWAVDVAAAWVSVAVAAELGELLPLHPTTTVARRSSAAIAIERGVCADIASFRGALRDQC